MPRVFPDSHVGKLNAAPGDFPGGEQGEELTVEFTLLGQPFVGLNGGPNFKPNEAISFMVVTEDQEETDRYGTPSPATAARKAPAAGARTNGASRGRSRRACCSRRISSDKAAAKRAFEAMMTMKKIDIADDRGGAEGRNRRCVS